LSGIGRAIWEHIIDHSSGARLGYDVQEEDVINGQLKVIS
jgi:hypothetical protein